MEHLLCHRSFMTTLRLLSALFFLAVSAPLLAGKNANISIKQGTYKLNNKSKPVYGPRLPINGPVIQVYAESGTTYNHVANKHKKLVFLSDYTASCSGKHWVNAVTVTIAGESGSGSKTGDGYETGHAIVEVPYDKVSGLKPVEWCNDHLTTLSLEKNKSKESIVKTGFTLYVDDVVPVHGTAFCQHKILRGDVDSADTKLGVWLSCEGNPNVDRPKRTTATRGVDPDYGETTSVFKKAVLAAKNTRLVGKSPQRLELVGKITTSGADTIKVQFVGSGGFESPVREIKISKAKTEDVLWTHYVRKADPGKTLAMDASGDPDKVKGWVAMKVWYTVRNKIARAQKLYTTPRLEYSVDFDPGAESKRLEIQEAGSAKSRPIVRGWDAERKEKIEGDSEL